MNRTAILAMIVCVTASGALGCSSASKRPAPAPTLSEPVFQAPPAAENPGSIFSQSQAGFLFEDNRARHIGDIVMVNIVENSRGKNKAETKSDKDSTVDIGVENYFGNRTFDGSLTGQLGGPNFGLVGNTGQNAMVKAGTSNKFKAKGETKRESDVSASIGCRVVAILPGGVMQVEGARETKVNDENQIIVVRGLVRPTDIDPDNSVESTALADCKIEYYGEGVLADRQKPGWLSRILDNVWPF
ncbi:flagellar basal body L-ring protein [Desulfovibrio sulfodismutans]|uniref:Flagellar L-ring protein n=1 Tax=Desulfolutivibrio sulfodismutans TaxID=63561 RepID=A0A7K3NMX6_9BACT|nr:flagellar basal body L-ring protein FlgH [Desulfolutivibrio sulfodismutans]NDY57544.1 flagellar basal body L-ring protein [Desulfolutivibrio sulfodismutans]QLA14328.1 flagellar basal body L-ring protein [Desulfolutivibrio sulfodismutans DSM 3696]